MISVFLQLTFFVLSFISSSEGICSRDVYSTLPPLPSFPSTPFAGVSPVNYTSNHWSAGVTLLRPPPFVAPGAQTNCPHLASGLLDWHDPATWPSGTVPADGADVSIPDGVSVLVSSCSAPTFIFGTITIPATSALIFGDAAITFQCHGMLIYGSLSMGSPTCRLQNELKITVYGSRSAQSLPVSDEVKGLKVVGTSASIDIHGVEYYPTWTRLAVTAYAGNSTIFIQDRPNWKAGQTIVITTTELKDSRDWHRNEEAIISSVTTVNGGLAAVTLTTSLQYNHYGGKEYQAEVALLSRNILIQGDPNNSEPTDTTPLSCTYGTSPATFPCDNTFLTGFGVTMKVETGAKWGRFSGVELYRAGQTNQMGKYPFHFHMIGNITTPDLFYVSDCSVHRSYFRCFTIHGTSGKDDVANGVVLTKNTAYDAVGHCFFASEDGVEENNTISYNFAAHIHTLGPTWQANYGVTLGSYSSGSQSFGSQNTATINSYSDLMLSDDISASPYYFTNSYVKIIGNAASGGWAGYAFPNLAKPVGLFIDNQWFVPKNRPVLLFQGNSAHSTGFWQGHAAGVYLGGELKYDPSITTGSRTSYTTGRAVTRDTCQNPVFGSVANPNSCPTDSIKWLQFYDTKVFLANIGLQSWGNREELIRFEVHDVALSTNVFGQVWIDQMLCNCRTQNTITWLQGCNQTAGPNKSPWDCTPAHYQFFQGFAGFQFYDTGQTHMVTNSKFSNCHKNQSYVNPNYKCINSGGLCSVQVFQYLTHSDQFTPGLMQLTSNITFETVEFTRRLAPTVNQDGAKQTVSGRAASWLDVDGSILGLFNQTTSIGSNASGSDWWRFSDFCVNQEYNWICPMYRGDGLASLNLHWNKALESLIGTTYCSNGKVDLGGGVFDYLPCPIGATVTHFGRSERNAYPVAVMPRVTGPIINDCGGWFVRYVGGTPKSVSFSDMQIDHDDILHIAIPYPPGTTFSIYAQAPPWCNPGTAPFQPWYSICQHFFRQVNSEAEVRQAWGDAYFWNETSQTLHLRLVALDSFPGRFATRATENQTLIWNSTSTTTRKFARGGQQLLYTGSSFWSVNIDVTSSNCDTNSRCPEIATASVNVPNASQIIVGGGAIGAGGTPGQGAPGPALVLGGDGARVEFTLLSSILLVVFTIYCL